MPDIILNGLDPLTGEYLVPPMDVDAAAGIASTAPPAHASTAVLSQTAAIVHDSVSAQTLGLPFGFDPRNIAQCGWGLVFHSQEDPEVVKAFDPLLALRSQQVGNPAKIKGHLVYNGEQFAPWLAALHVSPGDIKPIRVPFYLLVVGDPEKIPFEFTQLLAINYAVGRLHLDSVADYQRYVRAVIDYDTTAGATNAKEALFFGTSHINDGATNLSCEQLVKPLANGIDGDPGPAQEAGFQTSKLFAQQATKAALLEYLTRPAAKNPPALLFSASHGLGWHLDDPRQQTSQGAILCGDWKGLGFSPVPIMPDQYLAASDVKDGNVRNLIAFVFACYGLATPAQDKFSFKPPAPPATIAAKPFFSPLPKALLSASHGPALAVFGHMERAWASSIQPPGAGPQIQPFENALRSILAGDPIGLALTGFRDRYGNFAGILNGLLANKLLQLPVDNTQLATAWTQENDAEAYMLFGDPAIKLRFEKLQAV